MGHLQFRSGEGIRYPRSGELVGRVAELLRIKGYLRDGWGRATRRHNATSAGEPINETKDLLRTLVEALVPEGFALAAVVTEPEADVRDWMCDVLCDALRRWDFFVGRTQKLPSGAWRIRFINADGKRESKTGECQDRCRMSVSC